MADFSDLTWDHLSAWAGARVVARGKSYRGNVEDLRVTADGRLLAWVRGSERYATVVSLPMKGKPASVCTCPYGTACKHAVATVLVYLEAVKAKKEVPSAEEDDERFEELEDFEDDDEDEDETAPVPSRAKKEDEVDAYLARLSKDELLHVVQEALCEVPALRKRLADRAELAVAGLSQIGQSDDEGETGQEVASCLDIVFRALARSSRPDAEKLLWERRVRLREDYGFFDGLPSLWTDGTAFPAAVWSEVADRLLKLAPPMPEGKPGSRADADSSSARYARGRIMRSVFEALNRAGRRSGRR
jgi:uncharacterized Zn finger protein